MTDKLTKERLESLRRVAEDLDEDQVMALKPSVLLSLIAAARASLECSRARPKSQWHEDMGDVLWWVLPVAEPPYVGSPLDMDWPDYHTHWTPLPLPPEPTNGR